MDLVTVSGIFAAIVAHFTLLGASHWASDRGIGVYNGYGLFNYLADQPPVPPPLPSYWASRASESYSAAVTSPPINDPYFTWSFTLATPTSTPTSTITASTETIIHTLQSTPTVTSAPFVASRPIQASQLWPTIRRYSLHIIIFFASLTATAHEYRTQIWELWQGLKPKPALQLSRIENVANIEPRPESKSALTYSKTIQEDIAPSEPTPKPPPPTLELSQVRNVADIEPIQSSKPALSLSDVVHTDTPPIEPTRKPPPALSFSNVIGVDVAPRAAPKPTSPPQQPPQTFDYSEIVGIDIAPTEATFQRPSSQRMPTDDPASAPADTLLNAKDQEIASLQAQISDLSAKTPPTFDFSWVEGIDIAPSEASNRLPRSEQQSLSNPTSAASAPSSNTSDLELTSLRAELAKTVADRNSSYAENARLRAKATMHDQEMAQLKQAVGGGRDFVPHEQYKMGMRGKERGGFRSDYQIRGRGDPAQSSGQQGGFQQGDFGTSSRGRGGGGGGSPGPFSGGQGSFGYQGGQRGGFQGGSNRGGKDRGKGGSQIPRNPKLK